MASNDFMENSTDEQSPGIHEGSSSARIYEQNHEEDAEGSVETYRWECEVSFESGKDLKKKCDQCKKNPGHTSFIPIKEFLDPNKKLCDPDRLAAMRQISDRTVKITAFYVSKERPDFYEGTSIPYKLSDCKGQNSYRFGTGYVLHDAKLSNWRRCRCKKCRKPSRRDIVSYEIVMYTARHVIYNDEEAKGCIIDLFHDSKDSLNGVKKLRGFKCKTARDNRDWCKVYCCTKDKELADRLGKGYDGLAKRNGENEVKNRGWIISHPHGLSKHVSQGTFYFEGLAWRGSLPFAGVTHYRLPRTSHPSYKHNYNNNNNNKHDKISINDITDDDNNKNTEYDPVETSGYKEKYDRNYDYFYLPKCVKWIFPEGYNVDDAPRITPNYIKAPTGTQMEVPGGRRMPCPYLTEIHVRNLLDHLCYDISTCPGSSGAPILFLDEGGNLRVSLWLCHSGDDNGINRSSTNDMLITS